MKRIAFTESWLRAALALGPEPDEFTAPPRENPMSYSFTVRAATKSEAKWLVAAEFGKVLEAQPIHAADRTQAQAAADAFIDLMPDDDSKDVYVNVNGSVGWIGTQEAPSFISASVSVSASLVPKEASPA